MARTIVVPTTEGGNSAKRTSKRAGKSAWEQRYSENAKRHRGAAETISGVPLEPLYEPDSLPAGHFDDKQGYPGAHPYTRGVYSSMYRDKFWTMRQFSGFGSAEDTNK